MHRARTRSGMDYHPDEHLLMRAHPRTCEDALLRSEWGSMLALDPKVGPERDREVPEGLVVATCTWSEQVAIRPDGSMPGVHALEHPMDWATATLHPQEGPAPEVVHRGRSGLVRGEASRILVFRGEEVPMGAVLFGCGWGATVQLEAMEVGA